MSGRGPFRRLRFFVDNLSLQATIVLALLTGLVIPIIITAILDAQTQRRTLAENLREDQQKSVQVLAQGLQNPLWNLEPDSGRPLLDAVMNDPRIASVKVESPLQPNFLYTEEPERRVGKSIFMNAPVMRGREQIGRVTVEMTTGRMEAEHTDHRRRVLFALLMQVVVSAGIVAALLAYKVVGPLHQLVTQSRKFAEGELKPGVRWERKDEVGALGRSMDDMRRSLLDSFSALEQTNAELRDSEALHSGTIRNALDCIVTTDSDGRIIDFNPAAERTFGYKSSEVVGKRVGDVIVPPHLREAHMQGLKRYSMTGESKIIGQRVEIEAMRADGTLFPVEITLSDLSVGNRRVFAAFLRDLSEKKKAEEEIARQREALHQSEKLTALGSLLAGVAHELNNPLSVVVGQAVMLQESATEPKVAERAGRIKRAADRCARIVKTFLAMARSRPPETAPVRINDAIMAAVDLVGYGLRSSGVELSYDLDPGIPPIMADADQLGNVFTNLIVNAQQAMMDKQGPRTLHIQSSYDPAAKRARIRFADNGPGIDPEIRSRIFDPFFTTKPTGIGTGIGLSLCHGIVRSHGGSLDVSPTPGGGATFTVTLPAAPGAVDLRPAEAAAPGSAPRSILIVDDEPEIAETLADILRADGNVIDIASSGRGAVERLEKREYELILSDLRMPDMDGPAMYRWIKEHRPHLVHRIAFVTGDTLGRDVEGFLKDVAAPYIEKPFLPEDVKDLVAQVMSARPPAV